MSDQTLDIAGNRLAQKYEPWDLVRRVLWGIGANVRIHPSATICFPWNLLIGDWSSVGEDAFIYNPGPIRIADKVTVSQRAHFCAGTHDATVVFSGPVDDADKWHKYAAADLFVLPTHSENFGIVVAEALAAAVLVLTTTGTPWQELETHDCGWWVDPEPDAIREALATALRQPDATRDAMRARGRELVESTYTWPAVGRRMRAAYEWLLNDDGPCPGFVERQV